MSQFRGNTGTLIVVVARARALPNKRKLEKQNPYCLLRLANLTDKTRADLRGGQVPKWDQEFRFHLSPEMSPLMKLSVLDETKKAPTLIAEAEIDFTPVFYASVKDGFDKWHTLFSGDGREAGEIYLEMTFYPSSGSTTFSSSGRKLTSSYGSSASSGSMSASARRRQLPPVPGQEPVSPVKPDPDAIPAPLPRVFAPRQTSPPVGHVPFQEPEMFRESMNRSQMSVHDLPDVPPSRVMSEYPSSASPSAPQRITPPLREFPEFANYDSMPRTESHDRISSANAFDELEREVQLNYDGPQRGHSHKPSKPVPPPVPSHSSGSLKTGSYTSLAPPRSEPPSLSSTVYDIIEPLQASSRSDGGGSGGGRRSPTRKPPANFYKSGSSPKRLDLSSIPYDATAISTSPTRASPMMDFGERLETRKGSDVLLETHNAPTPYDVFVNQAGGSTGSNASMGSSGGRSRMSPSRFQSSLPPLPNKK